MKRWTPVFFITLIVALYFAGNLAWRNQQPVNFVLNRSEALHFRSAVNYWEVVHGNVFLLPRAFFTINCINAPIPPLITAALMSLGKQNVVALYTLFVNLIYLLALLVFTYKTAERLAGMTAGLLSITLLALYPAIYGLSRVYGHCDFPVAAAMAFNVFCLLKTDRFQNLRWSLLYGLSAGIGLLTKDIFIAFFLWPLAVAVCSVALQKPPRSRQLLHLCAAMVLGLTLAAPHYIKITTYRKVFYEMVSEPAGPWYGWENLRTFTVAIYQKLLSLPLFIAFIVGAVGFARSPRSRYVKLVMASWIIVPWLIMVFMPHKKMAFYAVPLLPAMAIVSAAGLLAVRIPFKKFLFTALLAVSVLQYFDFSYAGCGPGLEDWKMFSVCGRPIGYYAVSKEIVFSRDPRAERCEKLIQAIKTTPAAGGSVMFVMDDEYLWYLDPVVMNIAGWINGITLNSADDSVFWNLDTARPSSLFYLGSREFCSEDFFRDQLEIIQYMAETHPSIRDRVMRELTPEKIGRRKAFLHSVKNSFSKRTVLFTEPEFTGTLYHN